MPEVISDTSPLQYLSQIGLLHILPALAERIIAPQAVVEELAQGRAAGLSVPDPTKLEWMIIRRPVGVSTLALITDLGPGETETLLLALQSQDALVILDDALARRIAKTQGIRVIGTLGVLLEAKRAGHVPLIAPTSIDWIRCAFAWPRIPARQSSNWHVRRNSGAETQTRAHPDRQGEQAEAGPAAAREAGPWLLLEDQPYIIFRSL